MTKANDLNLAEILAKKSTAEDEKIKIGQTIIDHSKTHYSRNWPVRFYTKFVLVTNDFLAWTWDYTNSENAYSTTAIISSSLL